VLLSQDEARWPLVPTLHATLGVKGYRPMVGTWDHKDRDHLTGFLCACPYPAVLIPRPPLLHIIALDKNVCEGHTHAYEKEGPMKRWIPMLVLLMGLGGVHHIFAETPAKFQPFLGSWRFDSTEAFRCPCTIEIRDVHENGIVVGSFYIADGHDVLTEAKIAEKKNKMELTLTLMRGDMGWLELSQDRKQLSGTWERKVRRQGGSQHSRMSTLTFEKVVQGPAAIKQ
jgi:hypothetical protein